MGRLVAVAAMLLGLAVPAPGFAQDCEVPLFIQQSAADGNVMFLFDNSGSMNEAMYHPDYDPFTTYSGNFDNDDIYYVRSDGFRSPRNFNRRWPRNPVVYLVNSDNGKKGRYFGNYLNWIYFHASDEQRNAIPRQTRVQVAKAVVNDLIDRTSERIRIGITQFHIYGPGNIIGHVGMNRNALHAIVNGITALTWTPIAESMETILDYFCSDLPSAPIQESCQKNFLVIMTDGYPTMDLDVSSYLVDYDNDGNDPGSCTTIGAPYPNYNDCSDHMDDIALYMYENDLRPDLGQPGESGPEGQNMVTYTIGFGIDAGILAETAENGDGLYFLAENAAELAEAFNLVMQDILMRISSGSAVAVVSSEGSDDDRLYRGKFMPGSWEGYLEAYALPYEDGEAPIWDSGQMLADRSASNRLIFTALGPTMLPFELYYAGELASPMEVGDAGTAADLIQWSRGEEVLGYRNRNDWKLGDIVHSTPVVVGPPCHFSTDEQYQAFMEYYSTRPRLIYVEANDGMLHAFSAESGFEEWAFVPEYALPKLQTVADSNYCHVYSCDQTPSVRDVKLNGVWRTVLVGGGGRGGCGYFALDITEGSTPGLLWQAALPDGVSFSSEAEFARINNTPVVVMGSGLDEDDGEANLYVYELATGSLAGAKFLSSDNQERNKTTRPKAVDLNLDGETDLVYCADMLGNVWRAAVEGQVNPNQWNWSLLFSCSRPITAPTVPAYGEDNKIHVYFGTGAYLTEDDFLTADLNSFYCVYDSHDGGSHSRSDLVDQTYDIQDIGNADGWYVDLWHQDGERATGPAVVVAGAVLFTSFAPGMEVCSAGGNSWLWRLAYDDGGELEDEEGNTTPREEEVPGGVASQPVVDINNEEVIVQSSDSGITVGDIGASFFHLNVRSWQENFDFVVEPPPEQPPES